MINTYTQIKCPCDGNATRLGVKHQLGWVVNGMATLQMLICFFVMAAVPNDAAKAVAFIAFFATLVFWVVAIFRLDRKLRCTNCGSIVK